MEEVGRGACTQQEAYSQSGYKGLFCGGIQIMVPNLKIRTVKEVTVSSE